MFFEFITSTECNWNCPYCTFDRIPNKILTYESIEKHQYIFDILKKIKEEAEDISVVCGGGEIGYVEDNNLLKKLFEKINHPIIINTNGLFFETDRSLLYQYIGEVYYHVVPDAKTLVKIEPLNLPFPVSYGIVNDDMEESKRFIEYNPIIDFSDYEFISKPPKVIWDYENSRKLCYVVNPYVCIDLAREVMLPCAARGSHITIPLTKENLIGVLTGYNNFKEMNDMCKICFRMCRNVEINTMEFIMRRKMKLKNIL